MNATTLPDNPRAVLGGNNPPPEAPTDAEQAQPADLAEPAELVNATFADLTKFLAEMPVVENEDQAQKIRVQIDAAKAVLNGLEEGRDALVRPLNTRVKAINETAREARTPLEKLLTEALTRLAAFLKAEEDRRVAEAEKAKREAEAKIAAAQEAADREDEARENAAEGEFTDVGLAILDTDAKMAEAAAATRAAQLAERDTRVRVGGGMGKALGLRSKESLTIVDAPKALKAIIKAADGAIPEKIADAIITAARDYRKLKGKLPDGITASTERGL